MDVSLSSIVPYCLAVPGSGPSSNSGACISAMELCVRYLCGYGDMQCKWAEVRIVYFPIQGKCNIIDAHTYLRKKKTQLTPLCSNQRASNECRGGYQIKCTRVEVNLVRTCSYVQLLCSALRSDGIRPPFLNMSFTKNLSSYNKHQYKETSVFRCAAANLDDPTSTQVTNELMKQHRRRLRTLFLFNGCG